MDELHEHKRAGAHIFAAAAKYIRSHGWDHNSMDILLAATPGEKWRQPMAVLMYSELSDALGGRTLSQFDAQVKDSKEVIGLFTRVAKALET